MTADQPPHSEDAPAPRTVLHPVDWTVQAGAVDDVLRVMEVSLARRRRRRVRFAAAAGAAVALIAAMLVWRQTTSAAPDASAGRSVVVMVPAREVLPDGSIVELRRGARITPEFTPEVRRVVLVQGQAHFKVAHSAGQQNARPFVVAVGGIEVRAVGTAFSVQLGSTAVEVLVTEGRVAVATDAAKTRDQGPETRDQRPETKDQGTFNSQSPTLIYVDAGHSAVVELPPAPTVAPAAPQVAPIAPTEIDARLAWRVPRLEFSGTPLAEAIALINRHSSVRTVVDDPALGQLRVSGILRADNAENLWRLLEEQHGIRAERRSDTEVVLRRGR